jgi:hypothetical protein
MAKSAGSEAWRRFMASTDIDYERWHDGTPYDLAALAELEGDERDEAEAWLLARADEDWRDQEGLLALGTSRGRQAVIRQLRHGTIVMRLAAARRLSPDPTLGADVEAAVIDGLAVAEFGGGLTDAFELAVASPTPPVRDALFRACLRRETAVHAAAALDFLHGRSKEPFDWDRRPFYLQFNDDDPRVRRAAFRELCRTCGEDAGKYL